MRFHQRGGLVLMFIALWGQSVMNHNALVQASDLYSAVIGLATVVCAIIGVMLVLSRGHRGER
jgi:uncharacterized membrane protein